METMYITETEIKKMIQKYISLYLNPRAKERGQALEKWCLKEEYDISNSQGFYKKENISFNLRLKIKENYLRVYEIENIFFKTIISSNERVSNEFCNVVSSLLMMFYLPSYLSIHPKGFIHQKAISFFQLSNMHISSSVNDSFRSKYIRNLFYNSHLSDELNLLEFKDGILFFKDKPLKYFFLDLLKFNQSTDFCDIVFYCLSMIDFMENGFLESSKDFLFDDIYSLIANYNYLLNIREKPYKFRNLIKLLNNMYSFPKTTIGDFINKNFLLNILLFDDKAEFRIKKYIESEEILKEVIDDLVFLENTYLCNRAFNNK